MLSEQSWRKFQKRKSKDSYTHLASFNVLSLCVPVLDVSAVAMILHPIQPESAESPNLHFIPRLPTESTNDFHSLNFKHIFDQLDATNSRGGGGTS